jgi:hypothetical protein
MGGVNPQLGGGPPWFIERSSRRWGADPPVVPAVWGRGVRVGGEE